MYLPSGDAMLHRGCTGRRMSHRNRRPSMLQDTRCLSFGWLSPVTAALWRKLIDGFEGFAFRSHLRTPIVVLLEETGNPFLAHACSLGRP